jgi:hypothetical protein
VGLRGRFCRIFEMNLWGAATSVSGLGSEERATARLSQEIGPMLRSLGDVKRLLDAPCGDAGWIARADLGTVSYTGVDIVPELIHSLRRERAGFGEFLVADITRDALPSADAILCRDCLVHLSFDNIALVLKRFKATGAQWLITTTFTRWEHNADCEDGDWRALNLEHHPFCWSTPEYLLVEGCDEGGGWRDKSLGFWRLDRLPTLAAVAGSTQPFY